jgi:ribonucleoside-diphosphate reductase alpha chain
VQTPYEDCTKEDYEEFVKLLEDNDFEKRFNLDDVIESDDNTDLQGEQACAGGACEVK